MGNMTASTQSETHRITESTGTEAGILEMQEKGKIGKCLEELELARNRISDLRFTKPLLYRLSYASSAKMEFTIPKG